MGDSLRALKNFKVHVLALVLTVLCETLGGRVIALPVGSIAFFPMLYALVLGFVIGLPRLRVLGRVDREDSGLLIDMAVMLLLARCGTLVGPGFYKIIGSGPALILQELGGIGTAICAVPIAVWLGLRREAIGAGHSVAREGNVGLISELYGLSSPEGRGVMGVYVLGAVFGSVIIGLLASAIASWGLMSVESLAMASGVGSVGMAAASVGALQALFPDKAEIIGAYGSAGSMLTGLVGLYASLFLVLPVSERIYGFCCGIRYGKKPEGGKEEAIS
ncbi:MAG: DUF3100 domain-containing protein [Synergistaceae bacterium]|nr:DUF3100 domain-containing protein [Synergistaceae bacterium]